MFMRYIFAVLRPLIEDGTLVLYMDDLVILSKDEREGLEKLKKVLDVAMCSGLRIKWEKCKVLKKRVQFLGYIVDNATTTIGREDLCSGKLPSPARQKMSSTVSWPNILFPKVCEILCYHCQTFVELA